MGQGRLEVKSLYLHFSLLQTIADISKKSVRLVKSLKNFVV